MQKAELEKILASHREWLISPDRGCRADLRREDLSWMDLSGMDLSGVDLKGANLRGANLRGANLRGACLIDAILRDAILEGADLEGAIPSNADMRGADLSGCEGITDPIDFMEGHFERTLHGYVVYKVFNISYPPAPTWDTACGSEISEVVNPNPADVCGCGINVSTWHRVVRHRSERRIYKLLIKWEWLPGVVVPYNSDGDIRCSRALIIDRVEY